MNATQGVLDFEERLFCDGRQISDRGVYIDDAMEKLVYESKGSYAEIEVLKTKEGWKTGFCFSLKKKWRYFEHLKVSSTARPNRNLAIEIAALRMRNIQRHYLGMKESGEIKGQRVAALDLLRWCEILMKKHEGR